MSSRTVFGSLKQYEKGGLRIIRDDPRNYAFSNLFEVAAKSRPWERVAVARNMEYVLEAVRAEGASPWFAAAHDEFALVMDGAVEVRLRKLEGTRRSCRREPPTSSTRPIPACSSCRPSSARSPSSAGPRFALPTRRRTMAT